jgi:Fe-S-cluster containining protein
MSAANKSHEALVADWQANAKDHDEDNYHFLRSLKMRSPKKVDRIALQLHQEAFSIVDCTKCANCCRTLRPIVTDEDIARIARHLEMTGQDFIAAYLERDEEEARYRIKASPCPFLGDDNLCKIYDVRPEKCRGYPFTDKPDFVFMTMTHANNAVVCPAVFYLVEQMKRRLRR